MGIVTGWWRADAQHETSWQSRLQQRLELARVATLDKEAVRVVAIWQRDDTDVHALFPEPAGKQLRRLLAAAVRIGIKGQIDGSRTVAQLAILLPVEMTSHRTGDVVKTGLPQHGVIEQTSTRITFGYCRTCSQAYKPPLAPGRSGEVAPKPTGCGHRDCLAAETRRGACRCRSHGELPNRLDAMRGADSPTVS